jgi:hypothetical protein
MPREHVNSLHEILNSKNVRNAKPVEAKEERTVNLAMGKKEDGWAMPKEPWLDFEAAEDG